MLKPNFSIHIGTTRECIVYLDSLKKLSDGIYDAYVDFRTQKDLVIFQNFAQGFNDTNTYLELKSLKSTKRLIRGCYYKLNLNLLHNIEYRDEEDSYIIGRTYNMDQMSVPSGNDTELLQKHALLDPTEIIYTHVSENLNFPVFSHGNLRIMVRDVDQANWNELLEDNRVKIVYDLGAKLSAKKIDVQTLFTVRRKDFERDKPMLVISHWDKDHIHCLQYLDIADIKKNFSSFICIDKMKTLTAQNIYKKMLAALGKNNVCCLQSPTRTNGITMHCWVRVGCMSFYLGEDSRNINYSGLCMFVKGALQSVNFTGDVKLIQAKDIYDKELQYGLETTNSHILIAPHHGGDYGPKSRIYSASCSEVIISVGFNNQYDHPKKVMLNYLVKISANNIKRTDLNGDVIEAI